MFVCVCCVFVVVDIFIDFVDIYFFVFELFY